MLIQQGYEMEKEELMLFAPQRIHTEQLYVVVSKGSITCRQGGFDCSSLPAGLGGNGEFERKF